MIERPSARLILLDSQDRIFLFNVHTPSVYDPIDPFHEPFWIMIGGKVDPGEDYAGAARREALEETSLNVAGELCWVWSRERTMHWRKELVLHRERFFLGRAASTDVDTSKLDAHEKSWTLGHRWWTVDEIEGSRERFEPIDLGQRLRRLLAEGPPAEPTILS